MNCRSTRWLISVLLTMATWVFAHSAQADTLVAYDFETNAARFAASASDPDVTPANLSFRNSSGTSLTTPIIDADSAGDDAFQVLQNSLRLDIGTPLTTDARFTVTLATTPTTQIDDFTNLTFIWDNGFGDATRNQTFRLQLYASINGGATNAVGGVTTLALNTALATAPRTVTRSLATLNDADPQTPSLGANQNVVFILAMTRETTGNSAANVWFDDMTVTGTASVIPEPSSAALALVGMLGAGFLLRRRQR